VRTENKKKSKRGTRPYVFEDEVWEKILEENVTNQETQK
jgi:hypothetical protein